MNRSFLTAAAIVVSVVVQTPGVAAGQQPDGSDGPAVFVMTNNADHTEVIAFPTSGLPAAAGLNGIEAN
jgi:hypothetical protein